MARVTSFTAQRMLDIENNSVVSGVVDANGNLVLTKHGGQNINAGRVVGESGQDGKDGEDGERGAVATIWSANASYIENDVVWFSGSTYKALTPNVNSCPPFYSDKWVLVSSGSYEVLYQHNPFFNSPNLDDYTFSASAGTFTAQLTSNTSEKESGVNALKISLSANADVKVLDKSEHIVNVGDYLSIEVRARSLSGGPTTLTALVRIGDKDFSSSVDVVCIPEKSGNLGAQWTTYTFKHRITNSNPRAKIILAANTTTNASDVLIDRIKVTSNTSQKAQLEASGRIAQVLLSGTSRRIANTTGVGWSDPFTISGLGLGSQFGGSTIFSIAAPANGSVIPVYGSTPGATVIVSSNIIPLSSRRALYYELPNDSRATPDPAAFRIVDNTHNNTYTIDVPSNWVMICAAANSTTYSPYYKWGDGVYQDVWRNLTLLNGWTAWSTTSWNEPSWRFSSDGRIVLRGLMKGGSSGATTPFATIPSGLGPDAKDASGAAGAMFSTSTSGGGLARIDAHKNGNLVVAGYMAGGTNALVAIDGVSWYPAGF